ncbi:hypothetical protein Tco_1176051 [Tanacetum coccineum]
MKEEEAGGMAQGFDESKAVEWEQLATRVTITNSQATIDPFNSPVSRRHGGRTYQRDKDGTPFYPGFGQPEQEQCQHSESERLSALPYIYSYVEAWSWGHTQDEAKAKRYARSPLWSVSLGLLEETRPSP